MTRQELSGLLDLPASAPVADLLKAVAERTDGLREQLRQDGLPKPVKIKLQMDLAEFTAPPVAALCEELAHLRRIEGLLAEADAEMAKPGWTRGVVELLCGKLGPMMPGIASDDVRLGYEKRLVEVREKLRTSAPPIELPPVVREERVGPPPGGSTPPHDIPVRIEAYFAEVSAELGRPTPKKGMIRLWLQKIETLVERLVDEPAQVAYTKRIVEIRYKLDGSRPPWATEDDQTSPPPPPPPPPVRIKPVPGTLLQLLPRPMEGTLRRAGPPIHFVARSRFVLGRQRSKTDFVTWFLPESPDNQKKTDTISRVNTTLFLKGGQIWVHDGEAMEGGKFRPSAGTLIDDQPITTEALQLNFTKERVFRLGQAGYELKAIHLPATAPESSGGGSAATADVEATVVVAPRTYGCMRFQSVSCRDVQAQIVWIFSEASLGTGPNCAVVFDGSGLPPVAVQVHHREQGFWLAVPAGGKSVVGLDGQPLAAGTVHALHALHRLALGSLEFDLKVSS